MDREQCDFVTEISSKIPVAVIAEMLRRAAPGLAEVVSIDQ